jgi:hypothetical protein
VPNQRRRRRMTPRFRRIALIVHITTAVGWLGTTVVVLTLGITGLQTSEPSVQLVAYYDVFRVLNPGASVPLAFLGLASGIVLAIRGPFGLIRHRWVLTKLTASLIAVLINQEVTKDGAEQISARLAAGLPVGFTGAQVVFGACLNVVILTMNVGLSVTKPWGKTRWNGGRNDRRRRRHIAAAPVTTTT